MAATRAVSVKLVTATGRRLAMSSIYLSCRVKPGANKLREGVISVSEDIIELCTPARAVEGAANKAVVCIISDALKIPRSDMEIVRGLRSRDKTVAIHGIDIKDHASCLARIQMLLRNAIG